MFKVGDVVVCINDISCNQELIKNNKYIVSGVFDDEFLIVKEFNATPLLSSRFIHLSEYRKQKINKIKERICTDVEIR